MTDGTDGSHGTDGTDGTDGGDGFGLRSDDAVVVDAVPRAAASRAP